MLSAVTDQTGGLARTPLRFSVNLGRAFALREPVKAAVEFVRQQAVEARAEATQLQREVQLAVNPDTAVMAAARFKASFEAMTRIEAILKTLDTMEKDPHCIPLFIAGWKP